MQTYKASNKKQSLTASGTPVQVSRVHTFADVTDNREIANNSALGIFADPTLKTVKSQNKTTLKRPLGPTFLHDSTLQTAVKEDYGAGSQNITLDREMKKMKSVSITKPSLEMMNRFEHKRNQSIDPTGKLSGLGKIT